MREYMDYVIAKDENDECKLFTAPAWSHLSEGDLVLIERSNAVEVVSAITVGLDETEMIEFVKAATGNEEPRKLYGKIIIKEFEWEEDEDE